ncbi:MAG TPA: 30S ribosomal protein S2 [Candidatus Paceibacterota bacterium]|nr:30S ribosomal protein S2 [Candidatus Paceibacterota bacterium]
MQFNVTTMFEAGAHFGYSKTRRHPTVVPYLFGSKNGIDIIDIEKVHPLLEKAASVLADLGKAGKTVLFVGTKAEAKGAVESVAVALRQPFVTERWIGGILTNFPEIKKRIQKLEEMKEKRANGEYDKYTKKEKILLNRELDRLNKYFSGLVGMMKLPDAIVVVDTKKEHIAVTEAKKMGLTVIGIGNTDCSVKSVHYPIVANDGSRSSIELVLDILKAAYEQQ